MIKALIAVVSSVVVTLLTVPFLDRFSNFECFIIGMFTICVNALVIEKLDSIIEGRE